MLKGVSDVANVPNLPLKRVVHASHATTIHLNVDCLRTRHNPEFGSLTRVFLDATYVDTVL